MSAARHRRRGIRRTRNRCSWRYPSFDHLKSSKLSPGGPSAGRLACRRRASRHAGMSGSSYGAGRVGTTSARAAAVPFDGSRDTDSVRPLAAGWAPVPTSRRLLVGSTLATKRGRWVISGFSSVQPSKPAWLWDKSSLFDPSGLFARTLRFSSVIAATWQFGRWDVWTVVEELLLSTQGPARCFFYDPPVPRFFSPPGCSGSATSLVMISRDRRQ